MIWTQGAITVKMQVEDAFFYYDSGLYDTPCVEVANTQVQTLAVMGYTQTTFIAKNSWGTIWGNNNIFHFFYI